MKRRRALFAVTAAFAVIALDVGAENITKARYDTPVDRYGHYAPGRPHEYANLAATTDAGRGLVLQLPEEEVFEDTEPRLVRLGSRGAQEVLVLVVISARKSGSRLALIGLGDDGLKIVAQSAAIGAPMRWMNPVGVADLDGDGSAEIAAVVTPHIGGTLKVYRRAGGDLVEIASLAGFSNHVYGSPELSLSAPVVIAGRTLLLVPDTTRRHFRILTLKDGSLVETGRCSLRAPATGPVRLISSSQVSVGLDSGQQVVMLEDCLGKSGANPAAAGLGATTAGKSVPGSPRPNRRE